jgi:RNA polymerase sigma-70 factor (ECF subfamily)
MSTSAASPTVPAWESLRAELVRFVLARVGDPAAADDIVHDVLLRAIGQLDGPEPPRHLRGWLYRVTRNAIVDHYRARRPTAELPEEQAATLEQTESPEEADESAQYELAQCLVPLLGTLPPIYRQALTLAEVEALGQGEIARREGISLSGAKSRVQRARRMLRDAILDCCRVEIDRRGGLVDFERRGTCERC